MDNNNQIGFQLIGIRTEQFAIVEPKFDTNKPLEFTVNFDVGKDDNSKVVSLLFVSKFVDEGKAILILECSCHFKIEEKSWNKFQETETNVLVIPKGFITHLAVITVGTARGILHAKTEGTNFNGHILPTLNLLDVFTTDARIE